MTKKKSIIMLICGILGCGDSTVYIHIPVKAVAKPFVFLLYSVL